VRIGRPAGDVTVCSARLPDLAIAPPAEFEGPGDRWSPETLLCASVANCFILTFRAYARASARMDNARVPNRGGVDNVGGVSSLPLHHATLKVPAGVDAEGAPAL
jgi:organic hydroperoxide reductase OsmC/OhrA